MQASQEADSGLKKEIKHEGEDDGKDDRACHVSAAKAPNANKPPRKNVSGSEGSGISVSSADSGIAAGGVGKSSSGGAVKDGRFSGGAAATICSEAQAEEARNKDYDDHDADDVENVHGTLRSRDGNTTVTTPPRYRRERAAQSPIVASRWGDDRANLRLGIYPSWSILLAFNRTLPERHEDAPAVAGWEGGSCAANCFRPPALESQLDASRRRGCRAADRDFT